MKTKNEKSAPAVARRRARARTRSLTGSVAKSVPKEAIHIKTILVPLDFSSASMQALDYAIPLAKQFHSGIHLLYVHATDYDFETRVAAQLMIESAEMSAFLNARLANVQGEHSAPFRAEKSHVRFGRPYDQTCKLAREIEADMIVLLSRGQGGLPRVFFGSTAERIVQYAPCPVFVARHRKQNSQAPGAQKRPAQFDFAIRKILVPVDFSKCSLAGLKYAAAFAKQFNATLRLVHVLFPPNPVVMDRISANLSGEWDETRRMNAQLEMEALMRLEFLLGVQCETEIRTGYAIQEICAEIERADVDLVITSTHGQTGIKHALLGSVAEHVVRYAECPVLVVPSRAQKVRTPVRAKKRPVFSKAR